MEIQLKILPLLALLLCCTRAQSADTLKLTSKMFVGERQQIFLSNMESWRFHLGHNPAWAAEDYDDSHWAKMKPTQLTIQHADENGRAEGWFRVRIKIDSSFVGMPLGFRKGSWVAMDLYVEGKKLKTYGNTGKRDLYQENSPARRLSVDYPLVPNKIYTIAIHLVDYPNPLLKTQLKLQMEPERILRIVGPAHNQQLQTLILSEAIGESITISICVFISLLLLLLARINRHEKHLTLITITAILSSISIIINSLYENNKLSFLQTYIHEFIAPLLTFILFTWSLVSGSNQKIFN